MGYRLTSEERRIIERTRKQGEELHAERTPGQKREQTVRSVLMWVVGIVILALLGMLIVYAGTKF